MFENKTYEVIMDDLLSPVSDDYDKREGSIIWDALSPTALQLEEFYSWLDVVLNEMFADTASYTYLIKRASERGMLPYEETYAIVKMVATPSTVQIALGDKFNLGDLNYTVTSILNTPGEYQMTCDTPGTAANQQLGALIPIETENDMNDLESTEITEILIPGEDDEDVEDFRNRYYSSFQSEAFGGNVADYVEKVGKIDGVGGVKVFRRWRNGYDPSGFVPSTAVTTWYEGIIDTLPAAVKTWLTAVYTAALNKYLTVGGTVEIMIINSDWGVPSQVLIDTVQELVDPEESSGNGVGIAPIGHVVTVSSVEESTIDVTLIDVEYDSGYSFATLKTVIEESIDAFFTDLAKSWASSSEIVVRISQLTSTLLDIEGIVDIPSMELNGEADNVTLAEGQIPKRGEVVG